MKNCITHEDFTPAVGALFHDIAHTSSLIHDYLATAMISAAAGAIGNSNMLQIKPGWRVNPSLFFALVGRPGIGKTPPLKKMYEPVQAFDGDIRDAYTRRLAEFKIKKARKEADEEDRPELIKNLLSDTTPEALLWAHNVNKRGVTLYCDEIMSFFGTTCRYTNSSAMLEQLLSSWSGSSIDVIRRTDNVNLHIDVPAINIVGTIQNRRIPELCTKQLKNMGLIDRFLFCYPQNQKIEHWAVSQHSTPWNVGRDPMNTFAAAIRRIFTECAYDVANPHVRAFTPDAFAEFVAWKNAQIDSINERSEEDLEEESRANKSDTMVAKLALTIQVLEEALAANKFSEWVGVEAVRSALALLDYYETCYHDLRPCFEKENVKDTMADEKALLTVLPAEFKTADALAAGEKYSVSRRSVCRLLSAAVEHGFIKQIKKGFYRRLGSTCPPAPKVTTNYELRTTTKPDASPVGTNHEVRTATKPDASPVAAAPAVVAAPAAVEGEGYVNSVNGRVPNPIRPIPGWEGFDVSLTYT